VGGLWRATADLVRGRAFITMLYRSSQVSKVVTVVGLCTVFLRLEIERFLANLNLKHWQIFFNLK